MQFVLANSSHLAQEVLRQHWRCSRRGRLSPTQATPKNNVRWWYSISFDSGRCELRMSSENADEHPLTLTGRQAEDTPNVLQTEHDEGLNANARGTGPGSAPGE